MAEDRLQRIESTIDKLTTMVVALGARVRGVEVATGSLAVRLNNVETTTRRLAAGQDTLADQLTDLRNHIDRLHEEVIDRIEASDHANPGDVPA